jgi:hypothetical protein
MPIDPAKVLTKYVSRTQAAGQDWVDGIQNSTVDTVANMVKSNAKWKSKMQAAINNDTWVKRVSKLSTSDIKAMVAKVGAGAYTSGISNRQDKIGKAFARVMPLIDQVATTVRAMPDVTDADREARMIANVRGLRQIKGK